MASTDHPLCLFEQLVVLLDEESSRITSRKIGSPAVLMKACPELDETGFGDAEPC